MTKVTRSKVFDYETYLRSAHWQDVRKRWTESGRPTACVVCNNPMYELHHKTYKRLGREALDDLVPLCRDHHREVHGLPTETDWKAIKRRYRGYRKIFVAAFGLFELHYCYFCGAELDGHTSPLDATACIVHHQDGSGASSRPNNHPMNLKPAHHGCHMSHHLTERWEDPTMLVVVLDRLHAGRDQYWSDPGSRVKHRVRMQEWWSDPETRTANAFAIKEALADPAVKAAMREAATKRWEDDEYRSKMASIMSARAKGLWADPEWRATRMATNADPAYLAKKSESAKKQMADPKMLARLSATSKRNWQDPAYRERMAPNIKRMVDAANQPTTCPRCGRVVKGKGNFNRHLKACSREERINNE